MLFLMNARTESQPLLDVRKAAQLLGISTRTVYALVERNEVPHARVGGQIRFVPSTLEQWLRDGGKRA
jgi:excisionase family DNA binding protein